MDTVYTGTGVVVLSTTPTQYSRDGQSIPTSLTRLFVVFLWLVRMVKAEMR
jgi:hypothetical protein